MFWVFLFGCFWIMSFLFSILQFAISAAAAMWYFQNNNSDAPKASVTRGIYWALRYHIGSLALGSLLISIVTTTKIIFEYYAKKFERLEGESALVKTLMCLNRCMVWCLDQCVKFINENAYV